MTEMPIDLKRLTNLANTVRERAETATGARTNGRWYRVTNEYSSKAEIWIYDYIGLYGVEANAFVAELNNIRTPEIDLHIASEGGEVWDGLTIYAALRNHPAHINGYIDSLAASAASFIAMACDNVKMERTARLMMHEASGGVMGIAKDMREVADILDDMSDNIASIYAEKAGGEPKMWRKKMTATTWFNAEQAKEAGLVDEIIGSAKAADTIPSATISNVTETKPVFVWDADVFRKAIKEGIA